MEVRHPDDFPRSMRDPAVVARRRAMLQEDHIAPLTAYAARLRQMGLGQVPDFDPLDGGIEARVLFLFEKPGPMTADGSAKRSGSGFISRNNDDQSAEATFAFMDKAGLPRSATVTWNVMPWWNGSVRATTTELQEGLRQLSPLLALLPHLRTAVLVGRKAQSAMIHLMSARQEVELLASDHPSPRVRARWPERWRRIPFDWAKATQFLERR